MGAGHSRRREHGPGVGWPRQSRPQAPAEAALVSSQGQVVVASRTTAEGRTELGLRACPKAVPRHAAAGKAGTRDRRRGQ